MQHKVLDIVQAFDTVEKKCVMVQFAPLVPTTIPSLKADSIALIWDKWAILLNSQNISLTASSMVFVSMVFGNIIS